jgi:uridine kinase
MNDFLFHDLDDKKIADILGSMVVMVLNADPQHHVPNFPPDVEKIQNTVIHVLKSYGFFEVAEVYEIYRWGKHWIRQHAITPEQFAGNGFPGELTEETERWNQEHGCDTVEKVNALIEQNKMLDVIMASHEAYEKQLDRLIDVFTGRLNRGHDIKLLIVSGPSSSGKTTTTVKIYERLTQKGLKLVMMNLDNYFWPVNEHPTDWIADRDYETPHALDYNLINKHINTLLNGGTIEIPHYNFKTGDREPGKSFSIDKQTIILLDCLHGLYPPLTAGVSPDYKFRVYLENLSVMRHEKEGKLQPVQFTDVRLLRRMLRDSKYRNHQPIATLLHWEKVRSSEIANIIPFIQSVDMVVSGGFPFDLHVLKPNLASIFPKESDMVRYRHLFDSSIRFQRLQELLPKVQSMPQAMMDKIPGDCVVREFIGNSTLKIPHND